ncbi:MAG: acetylxylan esterase [Candidatus Omnitrophica bacterium]|nr:acetylxylan esterase [Candidatus Omnitrophota bacterium]
MRTLTFLLTVFFCAAFLSLNTPASSEEIFPAPSDLPSIAELPDPFTMFDGTPVKTPEQWYEQRRPELKKLFQYYMYGFMPDAPVIHAKTTKTDADVFGGKATLKEIEIRFPALPENESKIHLALFVPNQNQGPYPVFLGLNSHGNQTVVDYPGVTFNSDVYIRESNQGKGVNERGALKDFWCVENKIDRGYAFAVYYQGEMDPDFDDFTNGIHPFYQNLPYPKDAQWATISAWAWGLHRCIDYLVTDGDIDNDRICLIGHSRRGKTVLLAAALDERVALLVPHQSGTGGCALSRNNDQETVERINRVFPHWFDGNFKKFNDNEDKLPFDQHLLVSLVAPRALLDTAGLQDAWANYESALRNLKAADKVYKFLGTEGMVGEGVISGEAPINKETVGNLLQYRRDTRHTLNIGYWNRILDYADACLDK